MNLQELEQYFKNLLPFDEVERIDGSINGIQVEHRKKEIKKVAFAVDACMESFKRAVDQGADALVVHHGLFWGREQAIRGAHYDRLRYLLEQDLALIGIHLPLDKDLSHGNNVEMAQALGLQDIEEFGFYKSVPIGVAGTFPQEQRLEDISSKLFGDQRSILGMLGFGPSGIKTLALVSGGAPHEVKEAIDKGYDCYITGDASHQIYHLCQEQKINVIFGGHYNTETWGVRSLSNALAKDHSIETVFIDLPTGL